MRSFHHLLRAALFGAFALSASLSNARAQDETLTIVAARAILSADQAPLNDVAIEVRHGRIVSIRAGAGRQVLAAHPNDPDTIHIEAGTLMPGLIDTHVHLSAQTGRPWWGQAVQTDEMCTAGKLISRGRLLVFYAPANVG